MLRPRTAEEVASALADSPLARGGAIARGAGRSYGDAAQNGGGAVVDATALRGPIALDAERSLVHTGAGWSFAEILLHLAARGFTLPVVPGTRHLTVGGAIAADVHGKNHMRDGSLARQVESLTLCTPAEGPVRLSAQSRPELFHATLGGMGLTGVVVEAALRIVPLRSSRAVADIERLDSLEQALALMSGAQRHRYAIAWVDLLAEGRAFGRSVLTRSDEGPPPDEGRTPDTDWNPDAGRRSAEDRSPNGGEPSGRPRGYAPGGPPFRLRPLLTVPRRVPGGLLRPSAVRAFNAVRWRSAPRRAHGRTLSMSAQLFPLDVLGEWSRLYWPQGLVQYQFVVPRGAEDTLLRVVHRLRDRRQPMYLTVLKRFGPGGRAFEKGGPLSFPIEGFTLAIDLPASAPGMYRALDEADELVAGAGGRVYLAKDARLHPEMLGVMYPELDRFRELRAQVDPDGVLRSDMGRRLGLCG
ncbi:MAG TPA: FAD-binding oxidoreductase [Solirubrobacteraceae bacterium]|jgi:decaprenylphospho-beta-D-ribofuranose 2-oxidase|nr:FAD-binding oxidoreductase [Solirubrobacteraceae bacterium]